MGLNFCESPLLDNFAAQIFCDNQHVLHCAGHGESICGMAFSRAEGTHQIQMHTNISGCTVICTIILTLDQSESLHLQFFVIY